MAARIHTVNNDTLNKNLKALLLYQTKLAEKNDKKELFDDDKNVTLQIDFCMKPNFKNKSFFFDTEKAPAFDPETSEVCVIVKDDKKFQKKHEKAKYDQKVEQTKLFKSICPFVVDVLPYNVVKSDFKTFEQKRIFCNSYDFFVADRDLFDTLPGLLGSYFIKNKKMPRKINNLSEDNAHIKELMIRKLSQAVWQVDGRGTCTSIVIGKSSWTAKELLANAGKILEQVAENVPRGWNFVKSVHVKMENSIALEVYRKGEDSKAEKSESLGGDISKLSKEEEHAMKKINLPDSQLIKSYQNLVKNKELVNKKKKEDDKKPAVSGKKAKAADGPVAVEAKKRKVQSKS